MQNNDPEFKLQILQTIARKRLTNLDDNVIVIIQ